MEQTTYTVQQDRTELFRSICKEIQLQSGNCKESQTDFFSAKSIPEIVRVWRKYWHTILTEVPLATIASLDKHYKEFCSEINAAGVYYNEERDNGIIIVGTANKDFSFHGNAMVYVLGAVKSVVAEDHVRVYCNNPESTILLRGHAHGNIIAGKVIVCEFAEATINHSDAETHDAAIATVVNGTLTDYGHRQINAYNGSVVYSNIKKNISLYDSSRIIPLVNDNTNKTENE